MNWECSVARQLREKAHVSVHTLVFMTDNEKLPQCHRQPHIQILSLLSCLPTWSQLLHLCMCDCLFPSGVGWPMAVFLFSLLLLREGVFGILGVWCCAYKNICFCLECVQASFSRTGGAPFVCSGAVETRLHVMMTFVPVCLWGYSSVVELMTHFLSPSFPLTRDKRGGGLGNGIRRLERDDSGMW